MCHTNTFHVLFLVVMLVQWHHLLTYIAASVEQRRFRNAVLTRFSPSTKLRCNSIRYGVIARQEYILIPLPTLAAPLRTREFCVGRITRGITLTRVYYV